ncbi:MAG: T9SS type A sorting domain-containing protein [Ignavibacteriae bacterium]|nr:T9SS type A sorting domain-containing protein [Ignavibacteriota bacterium]
MKRIITLSILLLLLIFSHQTFSQRVIVLVIDGARYSESFGAESTYMPKIWKNMKPLGTLWSNFRNEGTTSTNPGHASMITGTWQTIDNNGNTRPTMPTVFEYFRKQTGTDSSAMYVAVGKSKLNILTYSTHAEYGAGYKASQFIGSNDATVYNGVVSIMNTKHPRLMVINFPTVDVVGHTGNWNNYLNAIRAADSLTYELWKKIQADTLYKDSTTLFITNDHGRHDSTHGGFQNHGDACEGCRHIMLLAIGQKFPAGKTVTTTRTQRDIATTIGELLSFTTPLSLGSNLLADTSSVTSVDNVEKISPSEFSLEQNFPNPFNPVTVISYQLKVKSSVTVKVFDIVGNEVAMIINEVQEAGFKSFRWNAGDLSSGVYYYQLNVGEFSQTKKLLLLR